MSMYRREVEQFFQAEYGGYASLLTKKIELWSNKTGLSFDGDGRAVIGKLEMPIYLGEYYDKLASSFSGGIRLGLDMWGGYLTAVLKTRKHITDGQYSTLIDSPAWLYQLVSCIASDKEVNTVSKYYEGDSYSTFREFQESVRMELSMLKEDNFKLFLTVGTTKIKFMSLIEDCQKLWESSSQKGREYVNYRQLEKSLRALGHTLNTSQELRKAKEYKEEYAGHSLWVITDNYQASLSKTQDDIILSVNPLDHLVMAGSNNVADNRYTDVTNAGGTGNYYTPTTFRTCWSTMFQYHDRHGDTLIYSNGEYANTQALLAYGALLEKGTMYIRNSNKPIELVIDTEVIKLYGVKSRTHAYLIDTKIWFDNMYPKATTGIRTIMQDALGEAYMTKGEFKELACEQCTTGTSGNGNSVYAIDWSPTNLKTALKVWDYNAEPFLDSVATNYDTNEAFIFWVENNRNSSARIDLSYTAGADMSPLYNVGILGTRGEPCECCGRIVDMDNDYYVVIGDYLFCSPDCAHEDGYVQCADCEDWYYADNGVTTPAGEYFCGANCAINSGYELCENCSEWTRGRNRRETENEYGDQIFFCDDECASQAGYNTCFECHDLTRNSNGYCDYHQPEDEDCDDEE